MAITFTKEVLTTAAKMRDEGKSWNEIREFAGVKSSSGTFLKWWDKEGITYRPSNAPKPDAAKAAKTNGGEKAAKPSAKPTKPAAKKATVKVKRTPQKAAPASDIKPVKKPRTQTASKGHPRTSNGKTEPVVTTIDEAVKEANARAEHFTGEVTKESVQANWTHLSAAEQEGFRSMNWAPTEAA